MSNITFDTYKGHKIAVIERDGYTVKMGFGKIDAIIAVADELQNTPEFREYKAKQKIRKQENAVKQVERKEKKLEATAEFLSQLSAEEKQALLSKVL